GFNTEYTRAGYIDVSGDDSGVYWSDWCLARITPCAYRERKLRTLPRKRRVLVIRLAPQTLRILMLSPELPPSTCSLASSASNRNKLNVQLFYYPLSMTG